MTTIEKVIIKIESKGINTLSLENSKLPSIIYQKVISALHFGEDEILKSNLGILSKKIALELYKEDGRKSVICQKTYKNILV